MLEYKYTIVCMYYVRTYLRTYVRTYVCMYILLAKILKVGVDTAENKLPKDT